jgi:hypothetical protein
VDLPAQIVRILRVMRPGSGWGVVGYSEGGFCPANLACATRTVTGSPGVLSGYFTPEDNQLAGADRVSPFGGNGRLREQNTPLDEIRALPMAAVIPRSWLAGGPSTGRTWAAPRSSGRICGCGSRMCR